MNQHRGQRRIVVGVDGCPTAVDALRWAVAEASLRRMELHVVHAWEHARRSVTWCMARARTPDRAEAEKAATARLEAQLRSALESMAEIMMTTEAVEGLPARVLLDRAIGAELLVLGSATAPGSDVIGPVARACLLHSPCPVVIVGTEVPAAPVPAQRPQRQAAHGRL